MTSYYKVRSLIGCEQRETFPRQIFSVSTVALKWQNTTATYRHNMAAIPFISSKKCIFQDRYYIKMTFLLRKKHFIIIILTQLTYVVFLQDFYSLPCKLR